MDRETAVKVIKQLFVQCSRVEGKSIKLMLPNGAASKACRIYIQTGDDDLLCSCLKEVAEQNGLAITQENTTAIIYKPPAKH